MSKYLAWASLIFCFDRISSAALRSTHFAYLVCFKHGTMSFLEVVYTATQISVAGPQHIISQLRLPAKEAKKHESVEATYFQGIKKVVISGEDTKVPMDVIFLAIYSRATSLSGKIVEEVTSPPGVPPRSVVRRVLWSFPSRKSLFFRFLRAINWYRIAEIFIMTFIIYFTSSYVSQINPVFLFSLIVFITIFKHLFA